jgi:hypothetical protein
MSPPNVGPVDVISILQWRSPAQMVSGSRAVESELLMSGRVLEADELIG